MSTPIKERSILFSAPMVRALLAGTKTQTRRAVKGLALEWLRPGMFTPEYTADKGNHLCPYGAPGDLLWVRETFMAFGRWETRFSAKEGRDEWHFADMTLECDRKHGYVADGGYPRQAPGRRQLAGATPDWWTQPAIFMPRAACRITLEVTGVRVERLQGISEEDAIAEGISHVADGFGLPDGSHFHADDPRVSYLSLWEAINGRESVESNPWVWAIDFRAVAGEKG